MHRRMYRKAQRQAAESRQTHTNTYSEPTRPAMWTRVMGSRPIFTLQPRLTINAPGDIYEQDADRVADQVMRLPEPAIQRNPG